MSKNPQSLRILKLLQSYNGNWVPLPEILDLRIACHTKRLSELRRAGHHIEIRDERVNGIRHTSYRLVLQREMFQ